MNGPADPAPSPVNAPHTPEERAAAYVKVSESPEFHHLRTKYRGFVFPVTIGALAFYFLYVGLAAYAPGFMAEKVVGNVNVGLIFGLLQFVMVFGVTAVYIRYAQRVLDPAATEIRTKMEAEGLR